MGDSLHRRVTDFSLPSPSLRELGCWGNGLRSFAASSAKGRGFEVRSGRSLWLDKCSTALPGPTLRLYLACRWSHDLSTT